MPNFIYHQNLLEKMNVYNVYKSYQYFTEQRQLFEQKIEKPKLTVTAGEVEGKKQTKKTPETKKNEVQAPSREKIIEMLSKTEQEYVPFTHTGKMETKDIILTEKERIQIKKQIREYLSNKFHSSSEAKNNPDIEKICKYLKNVPGSCITVPDVITDINMPPSCFIFTITVAIRKKIEDIKKQICITVSGKLHCSCNLYENENTEPDNPYTYTKSLDEGGIVPKPNSFTVQKTTPRFLNIRRFENVD